MGGVGGGDAKLLVAVGAFLGPKGLLVAVLATAVFGGVMSLAWSVRRGVILPMLMNTGGLLKYVFTAGRSGERVTLGHAGRSGRAVRRRHCCGDAFRPLVRRRDPGGAVAELFERGAGITPRRFMTGRRKAK
jgi:hypothetical protein